MTCPWQALWNFAVDQAARRGREPETVLDPIGLLVRDPDALAWGPYDATPVNSLTFATTGGDGVHFGIMLHSGVPGPIVMTVPMSWDNPNVMVGADLHEFLALGCRSGYFILEQLAYQRHEAAQDIEAGGSWFGDGSTELLMALRRAFGVDPWASIEPRLSAIEAKFKPLLRLSTDCS